MNDEQIKLQTGMYRNYISKALGKREVKTIKSFDLQIFVDDRNKHLSSSSIRKLASILNKIFNSAKQWNHLNNNPMIGVELPPVKSKEITILSSKGLNDFLNTAKKYQAYVALWVAANTGMRLSEVLGLHWKNVSLENKVIHVNEAYNESNKMMGTLKSKSSYRKISISE